MSEAANGNSAVNKGKLLLAVLAIVALIAAAKYFNVQSLLQDALDWIRSLGAAGPAAFIVIYIFATVAALPGSVLTLGAGAVFGVVFGSIYVSIASTLGAVLAFIIARYLARDAVGKRIARNEKFAAVDHAVGADGWRIVFLTRLSPVFPFNFLNYAFGLTKVSLRDYLTASWIGMMPGTVMYVYLGSLAGDLATIASGTTKHTRSSIEWALYLVGLLATVAVTIYVTKIARSALKERTDTYVQPQA